MKEYFSLFWVDWPVVRALALVVAFLAGFFLLVGWALGAVTEDDTSVAPCETTEELIDFFRDVDETVGVTILTAEQALVYINAAEEKGFGRPAVDPDRLAGILLVYMAPLPTIYVGIITSENRVCQAINIGLNDHRLIMLKVRGYGT